MQLPQMQTHYLQIMALWVLAYLFVGQIAVPLVLNGLGIDRMDLSMRGHAVLHLCLDISQLIITLGILWFCLKDFKPREKGLFPVSFKGWWFLWVVLACCSFPAVDWLSTQSQVGRHAACMHARA